MTQILTWHYVCRSVTYISWSSDFALYLEDYLMDNYHDWDIGSMWCIKCMWVSDLHFMVQWFCHILKTFWWQNVRYSLWYKHWPESVIYISCFSDFVIYWRLIWWTNFIIRILDPCDAKIYFIKHISQWPTFQCCTDIDSVWCLLWPTNICVGQWPIFHFTVILPYILDTIWWTSLILWILGPMTCISWFSDFELFTYFCL